MEPQPNPNPPPPPRALWTPARQRIFLAALLETGSVTRAARAAGMSRSSAQRLRLRLAGTPFDSTWDSVLAERHRNMADPFARQAAPVAQPRRAPAAPVPRR